MVAEHGKGTQHVIHHEAAVLEGVGRVVTVLRQHLAKHVDEVTGTCDRQLDIHVFQADIGIETAHFFQRLAAQHQCGCHGARLAVEEQVVEVQAAEGQVTVALLAGAHHLAILVDGFDVGRADAHFRLAVHVLHLGGDTVRQHDVVGAERHDQVALGASDRVVEGACQALVGLEAQVEAVLLLKALEHCRAVVLGAVIDHQKLDVLVGLVDDAGDACFDVARVVVRRDYHCHQRSVSNLVTLRTHVKSLALIRLYEAFVQATCLLFSELMAIQWLWQVFPILKEGASQGYGRHGAGHLAFYIWPDRLRRTG
ncbi:protein of unknown function [Pseudomonas inefficax]|uniref:Uncharacterized protein n=1 Tax=Pseudomonas inefficax TaxID=2078786 RepID=A0AAQ1P9G0_9PSED|nr:protein of unknown function [Pseudomonas inefficax]